MSEPESPESASPESASPALDDRGRPSAEIRAARRRSIREDAVNLPNLLTMLRIVLIPVALFLIVDGTPQATFMAAMVYAVSAITDFLDGWLARRMGLTSVLGKFLDPLADKLLVISSLVAMVAMGHVPAWAVILIVARELSITSLRVIAMSEGVQIAASQGGKEKAALQMVAVWMLMLHHTYHLNFGFFAVDTSFNAVGLVFLYLSLFFAITSAGEYFKLFVDAVELKEQRSGD